MKHPLLNARTKADCSSCKFCFDIHEEERDWAGKKITDRRYRCMLDDFMAGWDYSFRMGPMCMSNAVDNVTPGDVEWIEKHITGKGKVVAKGYNATYVRHLADGRVVLSFDGSEGVDIVLGTANGFPYCNDGKKLTNVYIREHLFQTFKNMVNKLDTHQYKHDNKQVRFVSGGQKYKHFCLLLQFWGYNVELVGKKSWKYVRYNIYMSEGQFLKFKELINKVEPR